MVRDLYLVAYDIREPRRLRKMLYLLKEYASGGQKSAFECYLTAGEKKELIEKAKERMELPVDALLIMRLSGRQCVETLGKAVEPADEIFTYIG